MDDRERRIASFRALVGLIREDLRYNGAVSWPGFQALAVYRFGVWKHAVRPKILRLPLTVLYRVAAVFIRNFYGIELFISTRVGRRVFIGHQHGIIIHPNAVIGDDCIIRQGVSIGQARPTPGKPMPPGPKIGDRVEIGAGAMIIGAITIGDDVLIGPNTVVMSNVPAMSLVTAPPSRIMPRPRRKPRPDPALPDPASPGAGSPVAETSDARTPMADTPGTPDADGPAPDLRTGDAASAGTTWRKTGT